VEFAEDFDFLTRAKKRFNVRRVNFRTYLYHMEAANRLCEIYKTDGEEGIREFRGKGR